MFEEPAYGELLDAFVVVGRCNEHVKERDSMLHLGRRKGIMTVKKMRKGQKGRGKRERERKGGREKKEIKV